MFGFAANQASPRTQMQRYMRIGMNIGLGAMAVGAAWAVFATLILLKFNMPTIEAYAWGFVATAFISPTFIAWLPFQRVRKPLTTYERSYDLTGLRHADYSEYITIPYE